MTLAHREYAGRLVSATQTSQVHKVYSVDIADIGNSYQNIEYCKVLNIDNSLIHSCPGARLEQEREGRTCKVKPPMAKAKAKTNKAKALTNKAKAKD